MELFDEVFNPGSIYDMLFINTKAVLTYPTLDKLKENQGLYDRWKYLADSKYHAGLVTNLALLEENYENNAIHYPEFSRILAITYGTVRIENGVPKRYLKRIANEDEYQVLSMFMDILYGISSEAVQSSPPYFPILAGHNIVNYDIPLLIKRFLAHKDKFKDAKRSENSGAINNLLPLMLKKVLSAKPWDSKVIDTVNVWKFNGNDYTPLMLISEHLGLKKTVDLDTLSDVSKKYWSMVGEKPTEALEYVALQSATQTNLVIQLLTQLREL